jgi:hypothetical protein
MNASQQRTASVVMSRTVLGGARTATGRRVVPTYPNGSSSRSGGLASTTELAICASPTVQ